MIHHKKKPVSDKKDLIMKIKIKLNVLKQWKINVEKRENV